MRFPFLWRPSARSVLLPWLLALLLSAACSGPRADAQDSSAAAADSTAGRDPAVPVEVEVVRTGPMESVLRSTATLEAEDQVIVAAEAARRVVEIRVEEGDEVHRGQLLLRLQDDEQRSALAKATTLLEQAEREWRRQEKLYEQKLTTEKAYNDALAAYEQRRLEKADAEREWGYTQVKAPIDGTVTQRFVKVGDQVNPGTQLFEIIDFTSLVARVYVPEKNLPRIAVGQPARILVPALGGRRYDAEVLRIAPVVDARTGTVKVTVDVGGQPGLRPGMYVDVELVTEVDPVAVRVPKRALVYEDDQVYVFLLHGDTVERVRIEPRMSDRDAVLPAAGVAAGDTLVVAGQAGLKSGARVEIVTREADGGQQS